jgi:uncharacterized protein YbdZ (MbtH family)
MRILILGLLFVALSFSQTCTTTDTLNVRSGPGTGNSVIRSLSPGTRVTLLSGQTQFANGHQWVRIAEGQWVAKTFLNCNGGGSNPPPSPPSGGGGSVGSFPTSYSASGYTFVGKRAQTLHFLKDRFTASATTYASHSEGALSSADLWTRGAAYGNDNSGVASMNQMADYIAANRGQLGVKYVIWKQRINLGSGWRQMENRGSITQNHFDHVHITFEGSWRATDPSSSTFSQSSSNSALPGWAIGIIALNVVIAITLVVLIVVVVRKMTRKREIRE